MEIIFLPFFIRNSINNFSWNIIIHVISVQLNIDIQRMRLSSIIRIQYLYGFYMIMNSCSIFFYKNPRLHGLYNALFHLNFESNLLLINDTTENTCASSRQIQRHSFQQRLSFIFYHDISEIKCAKKEQKEKLFWTKKYIYMMSMQLLLCGGIAIQKLWELLK